jgi:hypothetical protein
MIIKMLKTSIYVLLALLVMLVVPVGATAPEMQWSVPYDGQGASFDVAAGHYGMAVDGEGNVYVTGGSCNYSGRGCDYLTFKYGSDGHQVWVAFFDGAEYRKGPECSNNDDAATAMAVDGAGEVYVTGYVSFCNDSGTRGRQYVTIKYRGSNGAELWHTPYSGVGYGDNSPVALAVDGAGNVYVTGTGYMGSDYVTSTGDHVYDGYEYVTIMYDTNGQQRWEKHYNYDYPYNGDHYAANYAVALAVDGARNVYVTGSSASIYNYDYVTIKYYTNGAQWVQRYNSSIAPGENPQDTPSALVVDETGNVYVTGSSYSNLTGKDYATIKYDTNGTQLWVSRFKSSGNANDVATSLAVDRAGNVYVTGDPSTIKYDKDGTQIWEAPYSAGTAVAVDAAGNVYVTGSNDFGIIKYDTNNGSQLWATPAYYAGWPWALVVDGAGNIYVNGTAPGVAGDYDYVTIKYVDVNTPAGDNVVVQPVDPATGATVTVTFDTVSQAGTTTLTTTTDTTSPPPPAGFHLLGLYYYDITTTALFSGNVTVCITNPSITPDTVLQHYDGVWADVTTSRPADDTICGTVTSFSLFGLFMPEATSVTVTAAVAGHPAGGSVSPSSQTVSHGATATFTVTTNAGYTATVSEGTLSGTTWSIPNITSAHTVTVTFTKVSAVQLIRNLIADVENLNLPKGNEHSLVSKLSDAIKSLKKGQENAAINQVNAFIHEVNALRGKKLTVAQADDLLIQAKYINDVIREKKRWREERKEREKGKGKERED